jgi:hypothetical protein
MSTAINSKFLQSLVGDLLGDTTQYSVDAAAASLPTGFRLNNIGDTATLQAAIAIDLGLIPLPPLQERQGIMLQESWLRILGHAIMMLENESGETPIRSYGVL